MTAPFSGSPWTSDLQPLTGMRNAGQIAAVDGGTGGEIVASMDLESASDREVVRQGLRNESTVRRTTVDGVVDAGAVMLVLPEDVVGRPRRADLRRAIGNYAVFHCLALPCRVKSQRW